MRYPASWIACSCLIIFSGSITGCTGQKSVKVEDNGPVSIMAGEWTKANPSDAGNDHLPIISNFSVQYDTSSRLIRIFYDVYDKEEKEVSVQVYHFTDKGNFLESFDNPAKGDVGNDVPVGAGKKIEIPVGDSLKNKSMKVALLIDDKAPFPVASFMKGVDTSLLRRNVECIYGIRHRTSNPAHLAAVKQQLKDSLTGYGYGIISEKFDYKGYEAENIIARKPGYGQKKKKLVVCAHFDTVVDSPGADDNASGIAALLEMARILSSLPAENAIEISLFDLEEAGMVGSRKYVSMQDNKREEIIGAINLDMIGYMSSEKHSQAIPETIALAFPGIKRKVEENEGRGDFILCIANEKSADLRDEFIGLSEKNLPARKVISILTPGKSEVVPYLRYSDHSSFWDKDYPAIFIGDGSDSRNLNYHSSRDTTGTLNYGYMKDATEAILGMALVKANAKHGITIWKTINL